MLRASCQPLRRLSRLRPRALACMAEPPNTLARLRAALQQHSIDAFIVPSAGENDQHAAPRAAIEPRATCCVWRVACGFRDSHMLAALPQTRTRANTCRHMTSGGRFCLASPALLEQRW